MRLRWAAALLVALTVAAAAPGLGGGFVFDDVPLVRDNPLLSGPLQPAAVLAGDLWAGTGDASGYHRPVLLMDLWVDRQLFGAHPLAFKLRSLLWHLLATALCAVWVGRRVGAPAGLVAAGIVGLHPIQSEAVTWIAARNDPMGAAVVWAALLVGARGGAGRAVGAAVLAALAAGVKETGYLLPLVGLLAYPERRRALPLALGVGLMAALRLAAGVDAAAAPTGEGWAALGGSAPALALLVLGWIGAPWPLAVGHHLFWLPPLSAVSPWLFAAPALALALWLAWRSRAPGQRGEVLRGLAFAALTGGPALVAVADKGLIGERYLYLPLAGLAWAVAAAGAPWDGRGPRAALLGLALSGAALFGVRAAEWESDLTLWGSAAARLGTPPAWTGLGHARSIAGDAPGALEAFVNGLDARPGDVESCAPSIRTARGLGQVALAAQLAAWSVGKGCHGVEWERERGLALAEAGEWEAVAGAAAGQDGEAAVAWAVPALAAALWAGDGPAAARWEAAGGGDVARQAALALLARSPAR